MPWYRRARKSTTPSQPVRRPATRRVVVPNPGRPPHSTQPAQRLSRRERRAMEGQGVGPQRNTRSRKWIKLGLAGAFATALGLGWLLTREAPLPARETKSGRPDAVVDERTLPRPSERRPGSNLSIEFEGKIEKLTVEEFSRLPIVAPTFKGRGTVIGKEDIASLGFDLKKPVWFLDPKNGWTQPTFLAFLQTNQPRALKLMVNVQDQNIMGSDGVPLKEYGFYVLHQPDPTVEGGRIVFELGGKPYSVPLIEFAKKYRAPIVEVYGP